jgi:hypothetical protein
VAQDESLKANLKTEHGGTMTKDAGGAVVDSGHKLALVETSRRLSVFPYANAAGIEIEGELPFRAVDPVVNGELNDEYFEKIRKAENLGDLITNGLLVLESKPEPEAEAAEETKADQLAPYRNHFTLYSKGVLADAKNGGLRRDLSRGLDDQYFEKLHDLPVFGVDRYGKATANGTSEPIGDQWKFFRDFYNFYRPVDDGLVSDLSPKNIFYGHSDARSPDSSTRMRYANEYVGKWINHIYNAKNYPNSNTPVYSEKITPTIHAEKYRDNYIDEDDWHIFSPMLRPVVLRKTIRIGLQTRLITAGDPINSADDELNVGKYALQFKVYPSMVFWNPFNVTIDLDPGDSDNPLAIGRAIKFHTGGNIDVPININGKEYKLDLSLIGPWITAFSEEGFKSENMPKELAPGEILMLGLKDSYFTKIEKKLYQPPPNVIAEGINGEAIYNGLQKREFLRWNSVSMAPVLGSQNDIKDDEIANNRRFHLYPAASSYNVKSENCIIFENTYFNGLKRTVEDGNALSVNYRLPNGRLISTKLEVTTHDDPPLYLDGNTPIVIMPNPNQRFSNEYWWQGFIVEDSGKHNPTFHLVENADLIYLDEEVTYSSASAISSGDPYPFYQIDFRARTLEDEDASGGYGNPAFPSFANVNFLGSTTLTVQGGAPGDTTGDVKALYIQERLSKAASFDELPPHDSSTGNAFYGESFDAGVSRIIQYDIPRHPIISIADFKNITIGWYEDAPPRPIGASWPNATINDLSTPYIRSNRSNGNFGDGAGCDTSYFYNNALFDSFFFSGIPSEELGAVLSGRTFPFGKKFDQPYVDSGKPLANTRLIYYEDPNVDDFRELVSSADLTTADGFEKTAAHLMIDAPFNINSTSPTAWQAILSGFRGQTINGIDHKTKVLKDYKGFGSPFVDHFIPAADDESLYTGHRRLTDNQIADLSAALTREIRDRGISHSLGDFLNRDLKAGIDSDVNNDENNLMGRIDEAIKLAGLNTTQRITDSTTSDEEVTARPDLNDGAHMFAANLAGETGAGLPGYLKQQDIIRPLAPIMTSRGDTFVIRAYGESVNPGTNKVMGKAKCEVVVQRVPDYVEDSIQAWEMPSLGSQNEKFGRRLKIVSFRWLNDNDA